MADEITDEQIMRITTTIIEGSNDELAAFIRKSGWSPDGSDVRPSVKSGHPDVFPDVPDATFLEASVIPDVFPDALTDGRPDVRPASVSTSGIRPQHLLPEFHEGALPPALVSGELTSTEIVPVETELVVDRPRPRRSNRALYGMFLLVLFSGSVAATLAYRFQVPIEASVQPSPKAGASPQAAAVTTKETAPKKEQPQLKSAGPPPPPQSGQPKRSSSKGCITIPLPATMTPTNVNCQ